MKILYINTFYYPFGNGGAERSLQVLVEGLSLKGSNCSVICCSDKNEYKKINGVDVFYVKINPFFSSSSKLGKIFFHIIDFFNPYSLVKILLIAKKIKPDIVNFNNIYGFSSSVFLLKFFIKSKYIITLRDYYNMCFKSSLFHSGCKNKQGIVCKIITYLRKIILNRTIDCVVANSDKTLSIFLDSGYFKSNNIIKEVIYNGFNIKECKRKKSINFNGRLKIGFFGKVCADKGFDLFMKATADLDADFYIAGSWSTTQYDKNNLPLNYTYLDYITPDVFFNIIDILVVPSLWHDPLPRTIFESMSYGIPVIGSNLGGIPEAITHDSGWIFDPEINYDLKNKLHDIISGKFNLEIYSISALNNSKIFDENITQDNYLALYNKMWSNL